MDKIFQDRKNLNKGTYSGIRCPILKYDGSKFSYIVSHFQIQGQVMEMEILENAIVSTNNINVSKTDCCLGLMIMNTFIRNRRYRLKLFIKNKKKKKKTNNINGSQ